MLLCQLLRIPAEHGPRRQANAGVEKRVLRTAGRDPRWVPNPARQSRCKRGSPTTEITPAHACRRGPCSADDRTESDKVVLMALGARRSALGARKRGSGEPQAVVDISLLNAQPGVLATT